MQRVGASGRWSARAGPEWALVVAAALTAACSGPGAPGPDELDVVAVPAPEVEPARPSYRLRIELEGGEAAGPHELWLPLPTSDEHQRVEELLVEVPPPGDHDFETTAAGDRLLHVRGPDGLPAARVRLRVDRTEAPDRPWRPELPEPAQHPDPAGFVAEAGRLGLVAREVRGVVAGGGERRWPEVLLDGVWTPVDLERRLLGLPPGVVRLGTAAPRLLIAGAAAPLVARYHLDPR